MSGYGGNAAIRTKSHFTWCFLGLFRARYGKKSQYVQKNLQNVNIKENE